MFRISNIRIGIDDVAAPESAIARAVGLPLSAVNSVRLVRRSVDARRGHAPVIVLTVEADFRPGHSPASCAPGVSVESVEQVVYPIVEPGREKARHRPVVVGSGPAGLFCALTLARAGYRPLMLERGQRMPERIAAVESHVSGGALDPENNVQFGEGGAGTFSDGKLTTRIRDYRCASVLKTLVESGAPACIAWEHMPHVGTDMLRQVIPALTDSVSSLGGETRFGCRVDRVVRTAEGRISGIETSDGFIPADIVVMAVGHSARDTIESLCSTGITIEPKPFAAGVRIEHEQARIDAAQYGPFAGHPALPPATYRLAETISPTRAAYTFCMCPGGSIVNASSENDGVVTNGMSNFSRSGRYANSAVVVNVRVEDFESPGPLGGTAFQKALERAAFVAVGSRSALPVQTVGEFIRGRRVPLPGCSLPESSVVNIPLASILPGFIADTLRRAIPVMGRKIRGFDADGAVLAAPETRTSSPVRIVRNESFESVSTGGLYPCGEGAGYAGGIMSAAVDGIRVAEAVISRFAVTE